MPRSAASLRSVYQQRTPGSKRLYEKGLETMPGGIIKGAYDDPRTLGGHPLFVRSAEGCRVTDVDGNEYVDFSNHHTTTILGHSPPTVLEAIRDSLDQGLGLGHATALESQIAAELVSRVPSVEKVRYTNSGTEASLHACRMARAITGHNKIAKFEGQYHGSHDSVEWSVGLKTIGPANAPLPNPVAKGMPVAMAELVVILPWNLDEAEAVLEQAGDIAAIMYEGNLASALELPEGVAAHCKRVRSICDTLGALMIMDEVVSFRTSYSGFQGYVGVQPDLTIFGKAVGGGLPVGAIGGRAGVMNVLDASNPDTFLLNQSGTFSGNSLTLAAGLATLRALTPEVYSHLDRLARRLQEGLQASFEAARRPCRVVRCGSMVNVWPSSTPVVSMRAVAKLDTKWWELLSFALTCRGYRISSGWMMITISEPMTDQIIDEFVETVAEELAAESNELVATVATQLAQTQAQARL